MSSATGVVRTIDVYGPAPGAVTAVSTEWRWTEFTHQWSSDRTTWSPASRDRILAPHGVPGIGAPCSRSPTVPSSRAGTGVTSAEKTETHPWIRWELFTTGTLSPGTCTSLSRTWDPSPARLRTLILM